MKRLMVALMAVSLVLGGISFAAAAGQPDVLKGLNLSDVQQITNTEAQNIRGEGGPYGPYMPPGAGDGIPNLYDWDTPGPHSPHG